MFSRLDQEHNSHCVVVFCVPHMQKQPQFKNYKMLMLTPMLNLDQIDNMTTKPIEIEILWNSAWIENI